MDGTRLVNKAARPNEALTIRFSTGKLNRHKEAQKAHKQD
jgi:hypothetical protein